MQDSREFDDICEKYTPLVYRYCFYRMNCDKSLADEAVNDVFIVLYQKYKKDALEKDIVPLLYKIANNVIKNNLRKHERYYVHNISMQSGFDDKEIEIPYYDSYFSDEKHGFEYINKIKQILSEEEKILFDLRFIEGENIHSIAEKLGVPYATAYYRITKLEKRVRKSVKNII